MFTAKTMMKTALTAITLSLLASPSMAQWWWQNAKYTSVPYCQFWSHGITRTYNNFIVHPDWSVESTHNVPVMKEGFYLMHDNEHNPGYDDDYAVSEGEGRLRVFGVSRNDSKRDYFTTPSEGDDECIKTKIGNQPHWRGIFFEYSNSYGTHTIRMIPDLHVRANNKPYVRGRWHIKWTPSDPNLDSCERNSTWWDRYFHHSNSYYTTWDSFTMAGSNEGSLLAYLQGQYDKVLNFADETKNISSPSDEEEYLQTIPRSHDRKLSIVRYDLGCGTREQREHQWKAVPVFSRSIRVYSFGDVPSPEGDTQPEILMRIDLARNLHGFNLRKRTRDQTSEQDGICYLRNLKTWESTTSTCDGKTGLGNEMTWSQVWKDNNEWDKVFYSWYDVYYSGPAGPDDMPIYEKLPDGDSEQDAGITRGTGRRRLLQQDEDDFVLDEEDVGAANSSQVGDNDLLASGEAFDFEEQEMRRIYDVNTAVEFESADQMMEIYDNCSQALDDHIDSVVGSEREELFQLCVVILASEDMTQSEQLLIALFLSAVSDEDEDRQFKELPRYGFLYAAITVAVMSVMLAVCAFFVYRRNRALSRENEELLRALHTRTYQATSV